MKKGSKHSPASLAKMAGRRIGNRNPNWKGGKALDANGYVRLFCPDHPNANYRGYIMEHRLVMETHLGRPLLPAESIRHINGNPTDKGVYDVN